MSNGLSQAEIDALLRGETPMPADGPAEAAPPEGSAGPASAAAPNPPPPSDGGAPDGGDEQDFSHLMTPPQMDAMGEIGNISMGTAATTLSTMLNRRVDITTPKVSIKNMRQIARLYPVPFVAVQVEYTKGLEGTNILFLRENDVKIITDLLMGGDGSNTGGELTAMHLSAISEVMNQMVGSSSTSMAKLMNLTIDISPPNAYAVNFADDIKNAPFSNIDEPLVRTSFLMEVEGLIHSEIMQVMPVAFASHLAEGLIGGGAAAAAETRVQTAEEIVNSAPRATPVSPAASAPVPAPAAPVPAAPQPRTMVDVRPAKFAAFDTPAGLSHGFDENMELLMDVPLTVSVELGKSRKHIKEILDFNVGSIIVLDKMAGDMVDVVVNGKLIAKAEVVVIDDNYGARITDIITPAKRIGTGQ